MISSVILPPAVYADHNPEYEVSYRASERKLANLSIMKSTLLDVIKAYGSSTDDTNDEYTWEKDGWTLSCLIDSSDSKVISIDVQGKKIPRNIGITGSGLKVGDDLRAVRRIYGPTYHRGKSYVSFEWRDGVTLDIDLNEEGKIMRFFLSAVEAAE